MKLSELIDLDEKTFQFILAGNENSGNQLVSINVPEKQIELQYKLEKFACQLRITTNMDKRHKKA